MGTRTGSRMTWPEIQTRSEFAGRWVALDHCKYDEKTAQPIEGDVVDSDEDLVELCSRMRTSDNRHCAILFCGAPALEAAPRVSKTAQDAGARRPSSPSGSFH